MAYRRLAILICVLCLCLTPYCAQAVSTVDALEAISVQKECVLDITYRYTTTALADVPVSVYHVADVSADFQYSLTAPFASSGLVLNGIRSSSEWDVVRSTLEACIVSNGTEPTANAVTDHAGQIRFSQLKPGLYFIPAVRVTHDEITYAFASALIALPGLGADGLWKYQVEVNTKAEIIPPAQKEIEMSVLKLWKGDQGTSKRPASIEAAIFRNGFLDRTVLLSEDNQWTYHWTAKEDGSIWTVAEQHVPAGYTVSVGQSGYTFILTNTLHPSESGSSTSSPQTGDTSNILFYTVLMYVSGILLLLVGMTGKRKRNEE